MNKALITAGLLLAGFATGAAAQDKPKPAAEPAKTAAGYDRPSDEVAGREHQHVVYWNDSMDHYDITMQVAADAYSADDLKLKPKSHK